MTKDGSQSLLDRQKRTMSLLNRYGRILPVLSASLARLSGYNDGKDPKDVETAIEMDPSLAIRLIFEDRHRLQSSPLNAASIPAMIYHLGASNVCEGISKYKRHAVFLPNTEAERELWVHSLQVALLSRYIAKRQMDFKVDPEEAYLAGLIHDLGRFIILCEDVASFNELAKTRVETGKELVELERKVCGYDHAMLGVLASRAWNFPEQLTSVIRFHHCPERASREISSERALALVNIVSQADIVSFCMISHPSFPAASHEDQVLILKQSGFSLTEKFRDLTLPALAEVILPLHEKTVRISQTLFGGEEDSLTAAS